MASKADPHHVAKDIEHLVGGHGNVKSLGHCMTRLRLVLVDESKADADALKKGSGVLGALAGGGQYMVICGKDLLPIYEAASNDFGFTASGSGGKKLLTLKSTGAAAIGYVSSSVSTLVPGLVAGSMLKVALLLVSMVLRRSRASRTYSSF